jgi:hypothetical protein
MMAYDDPGDATPLCAHALTAADALPDPATITACPVCWRRWRIAEARMRGWSPLAAVSARHLTGRMAAEAAGTDPDPALSQSFYAFLAGSPADEADFAAACVVAFAPLDPQPPRHPPADFGWRALFADLPASPPAPVTLSTRIWQWREAAAPGSGPRYEARAFIRGESPPPFVPLAGDGAHWVRERAAYDGAEEATIVRQVAGPLALTLAENEGDTARLTLRLRGGAGVVSLPVRVYGGTEMRMPLWAGTLAGENGEVTIPLGRAASRSFRVEFDTAW